METKEKIPVITFFLKVKTQNSLFMKYDKDTIQAHDIKRQHVNQNTPNEAFEFLQKSLLTYSFPVILYSPKEEFFL